MFGRNSRAADAVRNTDLERVRLIIYGTVPTLLADVAVVALGHPEAAYPISGVWAAACAAIGGEVVAQRIGRRSAQPETQPELENLPGHSSSSTRSLSGPGAARRRGQRSAEGQARRAVQRR